VANDADLQDLHWMHARLPASETEGKILTILFTACGEAHVKNSILPLCLLPVLAHHLNSFILSDTASSFESRTSPVIRAPVFLRNG